DMYAGEKNRVYNLQNVIASQQMTANTVLDDAQYDRMFQQLDGAINTLAFNIRKSWVQLPTWLKDYVREDAMATGTKEMTAVGRALLSRVVHDEIFERYLHPGIYENLSRTLKKIESYLRGMYITTATTEESRQTGVAKVSAWRSATIEGLSGLIQRDSQEAKTKLAQMLTDDWKSRISEFLKSPAPTALEGGLRSIIDIALDLLEYRALETREIRTVFICPEQDIDTRFMTRDQSLPPFQTPQGDGNASKQEQEDQKPPSDTHANANARPGGKMRQAMLAVRMATQGSTPDAKEHGQGHGPGRSQAALQGAQSRPDSPAVSSVDSVPHELLLNRLRFASSFAVEVVVGGRVQVLKKAPVYPFVYE
ncbi:hypothetical protein KEM52_004235, partial [Ascosphaera acerosa]